MNKQEIFDKVVNHLMTQGKRAGILGDDSVFECRYRAEDGKKCAVGCLITDDAYTPDIEGSNISARSVQDAIRNSGIKMQEEDEIFNMLNDLQYIHDKVVTDRLPALRSSIESVSGT